MLLDSGSTPVTRKAAAEQIGEVQKLHPHELNNLLRKVNSLLWVNELLMISTTHKFISTTKSPEFIINHHDLSQINPSQCCYIMSVYMANEHAFAVN